MKFSTALKDSKKKIVDSWYTLVIENYPAESTKFLIKGKDRFSNPIGYTHHENLPIIFDALIKGESSDELIQALEAIIRLRAVQEFTASQAIGFIFQLKTVLREKFKEIAGKKGDLSDLMEFESQIDGTILIAFDIYMDMKKKIFEIKSMEQKKTFSTMVERLNKKYEAM